MKDEYNNAQYERRLNLILQRIDPKTYGYEKRRPVKNNPEPGPLKLTQKNRELILKYYKKMQNENISHARRHNVLGVLGRLLELLDTDFDTATREHFEELITKINKLNIGPVTRQDYLKKLKQLDKWFMGNDEYSPRTKWVKTGLGKKHSKLPSQLITPEEVKQLIEATRTVRDRALIHLMWESGARIGEIINLKMNSLQLEGSEARIRMKGKVGERQILLLECVRDLKDYLKTQKFTEYDEYLFTLYGNRSNGHPLTHQSIGQLLDKLNEKVQIKKRIYPYLFRHSRASYLAAQGLNEAQLCMIFGWTIGSKQPATYIHLAGAQVEQAYKQLYGLKKEEKQDKIIKCEFCGELNDSTIDTCQNCHNPLTIQGALKIKQEKEIMKQDRDLSQKVFAEAFKIMQEQKNISIDQAQQQAIEIIAKNHIKKLNT
ncbi:MAG: site-specific integrase [Candidatus ainarchaeum sp.]|nr:site-specific integrase [Candidatus ainarchaeum sp.]